MATKSSAIQTPAKDLDAEVGERVHMLMWKRKLTQANVARDIGIESATFGRKLRGERKWAVVELVAVAAALDTTVAYLVGESSGPANHGSKVRPTDYRVADSSEVVDMFTRKPIRAAG